jgi:hypothetical protein
VIVRRVAVTAVVVVGLLAGALGSAASAATVEPSEWAPEFCSTLATYQDTLTTGNDELTSSLEGVTNLKKARAKIVAFLGTMTTAAKTAKRDLQDAGAPSSTNGAKIAGAFVTALGQSGDLFAKAKAQAAKVSTSNPAAFQKQGAKVATNLGTAATKLSETFTGLPTLDSKAELSQALLAEPSCSNLYQST